MDAVKIRFNNIDTDKLSVCFTWDDNYLSHSRHTAPQFIKRGMRCTFYINPGEAGFEDKFLPGCRALSEMGFEIGSHGYRHDNYSEVSCAVFRRELVKSARAIKEHIGIYPATFAFPYHDYNDDMLLTARKHHLETRNTLGGSRRFGIKADSTLEEMIGFVNCCVSEGCSMVFSGHSAIPDDAQPHDTQEAGYGPIPVRSLSALLDHVESLGAKAQVLTFGQAALKRYITDSCEVCEGSFTLSGKQLGLLAAFDIDAERLRRLI